MATYKVPQDVEADDKLIGPFSFRQFIYLIIVALAGVLAWGLAQVFIVLAILPLPVILLFGALALPLRKDQPMEIYLAAMISFYLKPHKRLWDPDGVESLIEITAPKTVEVQRTKDITQADADQRFTYLADIVDSQGWAIRGGSVPGGNTTMNADILLEAKGAEDILDNSTSVAQSFDAMMTRETERVRQEAIDRMHQAPVEADPEAPDYDPYPDIQQAIVQPIDDPSHAYTAPSAQSDDDTDDTSDDQTPPTTSGNPVSADIMNLADNTDLSIATIAHEARRIQQKEDESNEVVISLR